MNQNQQAPQTLELLEAEIEQVSGGKAAGEIQNVYSRVQKDDTKSGSHSAL